MVWNEEGGVCTQKVITAIAVFAMVFAAGAILLDDSSDVDGASSVIKGEKNAVKVNGDLTYQIMFFESEEFETLGISYTADLKNSSGSRAGAVFPSSGNLSNGVETELTVTAPETAGRYVLTVTFTENKDDEDPVVTERTQTVTVLEPITLTAVLKNNSKVDFTDFAVYFYVDGGFVEDSKTLVSVVAGESETVSYEWVAENLSNGKHTFNVVAGDENIGDYKEVISGGEKEFYVGHYDYGLVNIFLAVFLVVLVVILIYLYRKPVKNYGKPKSRR
ncbi:MAG: hypothetical protein LBJ20_06365 [Candidatus Methanoplasma sp.]|jgi:hypothetical protein|nr:hypothetical protein [Candidatus Methanoplasma sp.]